MPVFSRESKYVTYLYCCARVKNNHGWGATQGGNRLLTGELLTLEEHCPTCPPLNGCLFFPGWVIMSDTSTGVQEEKLNMEWIHTRGTADGRNCVFFKVGNYVSYL